MPSCAGTPGGLQGHTDPLLPPAAAASPVKQLHIHRAVPRPLQAPKNPEAERFALGQM